MQSIQRDDVTASTPFFDLAHNLHRSLRDLASLLRQNRGAVTGQTGACRLVLNEDLDTASLESIDATSPNVTDQLHEGVMRSLDRFLLDNRRTLHPYGQADTDTNQICDCFFTGQEMTLHCGRTLCSDLRDAECFAST